MKRGARAKRQARPEVTVLAVLPTDPDALVQLPDGDVVTVQTVHIMLETRAICRRLLARYGDDAVA